MNAFKTEVELAMLALAAIFAAALADLRRIASWRNADVLAILSLGVSFALYDRGHPLVSVPLLYPPLIYLAARMVALGLGRGRRTVRGPSTRVLGGLLLAAVAVRVGFHMLLGQTTDVTYAGVFGADSILHGWPLYVADNGHLDTYGPAAYLAYVPASLLWPMTDWARGALTAVRGVEEGRRLGLLLALAFAACPWTFLNGRAVDERRPGGARAGRAALRAERAGGARRHPWHRGRDGRDDRCARRCGASDESRCGLRQRRRLPAAAPLVPEHLGAVSAAGAAQAGARGRTVGVRGGRRVAAPQA
jgi:hypothetical protein